MFSSNPLMVGTIDAILYLTVSDNFRSCPFTLRATIYSTVQPVLTCEITSKAAIPYATGGEKTGGKGPYNPKQPAHDA